MTEIRFYNTLTHTVERFEPVDPPRVYMYNCGPTVYDYQHVGNFKTFLFADVLRRFLELSGYEVRQVMNMTDVGHMTDDSIADGSGQDKMQVAAERLKEAKKQGLDHVSAIEDPGDPFQVAKFYIEAFVTDARILGLKVADEYPQRMPRATEYIEQMKEMIQRLIDTGHAYVADDSAVYYRVESFPDYGRLSGNTLDQLRGGAGGRVIAAHQAVKRHPADFLLWKPDPHHLMRWDSPWGAGYPGWHIECSAMATALLGRDIIDIHTGGEDNIFPHHECEIAQSRGATGEACFARHWMHSRHLVIEGQKMSKSKGNFYTVRQVLEGALTGRPVDPAVLRYELLKANYRSQMNLTRQGLEDSARNVSRIREIAVTFGEHAQPIGPDHPTLRRFIECLSDDLNIAGALGVLFEFLGSGHSCKSESLGVLQAIDTVLGILPTKTPEPNDDVSARCIAIDEARATKDYATSDRIRLELIEAGYDIKTTTEGTVATRKLA